MQEYFVQFKTIHRKQNLSNAFGISKEIWVTMHFSEIIRLQFRKKSYTLLYILVVFRNTNV